MRSGWWRHVLLFIFFWCITLVLYRHTVYAHFTDDFIGWIDRFQTQGWSGFLNSYGQNGLYYGYHFFMLGFYQLFSLQPLAWHLYLAALFALNACGVFCFSKQLLGHFRFNHPTAAAALAALLFLCYPFQTENVVWAATVHYQISMLLFFTGAWLLNRWRMDGNSKWLWIAGVVYALALVTLELALVFPALWFLIFCWKWNGRESLITTTTFFKKLLPVFVLLILFYFAATRLLHGQWVPHYGAAHHTASLQPTVLLGTFFKYLAKLFGFVHYAEYAQREAVYEFIGRHWVWPGVLFAAGAGWMMRHPKLRSAGWLVTGTFLLVFFALLPVLNLYFMYLNRIENDRLSFLATPYVALVFAFAVTRFRWWIGVPLAVILLTGMNSMLSKTTQCWAQAARVQQQAIDTFRWQKHQQVFVLNLPVNYGGVFVFRSADYFVRALKILGSKPVSGTITSVAGQNFYELTDGVSVKPNGTRQWTVSKLGWGWFWRNTLGASDYETDDYVFTLGDGEYTLRMKREPAPHEALIYFYNGQWHELPR